MRLVIVLLATLSLSACATPVPVSSKPLAPGEIALPSEPPIELLPGAVEACGGVGIDAVLHGDAADPHVAWLVTNLGHRVNVIWPPGYRARFTPNLKVLNADGNVVLSGGAAVFGACVTADPDVLYLEPPFR